MPLPATQICRTARWVLMTTFSPVAEVSVTMSPVATASRTSGSTWSTAARMRFHSPATSPL